MLGFGRRPYDLRGGVVLDNPGVSLGLLARQCEITLGPLGFETKRPLTVEKGHCSTSKSVQALGQSTYSTFCRQMRRCPAYLPSAPMHSLETLPMLVDSAAYQLEVPLHVQCLEQMGRDRLKASTKWPERLAKPMGVARLSRYTTAVLGMLWGSWPVSLGKKLACWAQLGRREALSKNIVQSASPGNFPPAKLSALRREQVSRRIPLEVDRLQRLAGERWRTCGTPRRESSA